MYTEIRTSTIHVTNDIIFIRNDDGIDETKVRVNMDGVFKMIKENLYSKNAA